MGAERCTCRKGKVVNCTVGIGYTAFKGLAVTCLVRPSWPNTCTVRKSLTTYKMLVKVVYLPFLKRGVVFDFRDSFFSELACLAKVFFAHKVPNTDHVSATTSWIFTLNFLS